MLANKPIGGAGWPLGVCIDSHQYSKTLQTLMFGSDHAYSIKSRMSPLSGLPAPCRTRKKNARAKGLGHRATKLLREIGSGE